MKRVLVLAGTAEARALCALLASMPGVEATASLAGATSEPATYPVPVVTGGFGGAEGLAAWLTAHGIGALIDATHPFATTMRRNAALAAELATVPSLRLERAPWTEGEGDCWTRHSSLDALLRALPAGARVFAALGTRAAVRLGDRPDIAFLLRAIEAPAVIPANVRILHARAALDAAAEAILLEREGITHLAARDSGGEAGRAKLLAARTLGLPVHLVARPADPGRIPCRATAQEAADWVARSLTLSDHPIAQPSFSRSAKR